MVRLELRGEQYTAIFEAELTRGTKNVRRVYHEGGDYEREVYYFDGKGLLKKGRKQTVFLFNSFYDRRSKDALHFDEELGYLMHGLDLDGYRRIEDIKEAYESLKSRVIKPKQLIDTYLSAIERIILGKRAEDKKKPVLERSPIQKLTLPLADLTNLIQSGLIADSDGQILMPSMLRESISQQLPL